MTKKNLIKKKINYNILAFCIALLTIFFLFIIFFVSPTKNYIEGFKINQKAPINEFDPQKTGINDGSVYNKRLFHIIHESLINKDKNSNLTVNEKPEEIKNNDQIIGYRFILKPNIKFHNNEIFKPTDFKFTIERFLKKHPNETIPFKIDLLKSIFDNKKNLIEIFYKKDFSTEFMLSELSQIYILNEKAITQDEQKGSKIGLGFFYLDSFKENINEEVILLKFKDYHNKENIKFPFEKIIFSSYEEITAINKINKGELSLVLDVESSTINNNTINKKIVNIQENNIYSVKCLFLNCKNTPLKIRKLIAQIIDMEEIFKELNINYKDEFIIPKNFIYHPDLLGYNENPTSNLRNPQQSFEETQKIIKNLKTEDKTLSFYLTPTTGYSKRILDKIIEKLTKAGFNIHQKINNNFNDMFKNVEKINSNHNIVFFGESFSSLDSTIALKTYFLLKNPKEHGIDKVCFFENEEINQIMDNIEKPISNTNIDNKNEKIKKIGTILNEQIPVIPIFGLKKNIFLINSKIKELKIEFNLLNLKKIKNNS